MPIVFLTENNFRRVFINFKIFKDKLNSYYFMHKSDLNLRLKSDDSSEFPLR